MAKRWYTRVRSNPGWQQVGEFGPFTSEKIARDQARNMPSPAPGFVINVEADSPKVRGAHRIGSQRKVEAIVNPRRRNPEDLWTVAMRVAPAGYASEVGTVFKWLEGNDMTWLLRDFVAALASGDVHNIYIDDRVRGKTVGRRPYQITRAAAVKALRALHGAPRSNPRRGARRSTVAPKLPDTIGADELLLYADNTFALYAQKQAIVANLAKKWKRGTYDEHKAITGWMHWMDAAARSYNREFGRGSTLVGFDKPTREYAAARMARGTTIAFRDGLFDEVYAD